MCGCYCNPLARVTLGAGSPSFLVNRALRLSGTAYSFFFHTKTEAFHLFFPIFYAALYKQLKGCVLCVHKATPTGKSHSVDLLQQWSYWREHLKYAWNVYCDVTNHRRDHHTTETTSNERFPICHGTNYFHFVLTFSLFTSKQLLFLPICLQYLL